MIKTIRKQYGKIITLEAKGRLNKEQVIAFLRQILRGIPPLRPAELREALLYFRRWKNWLVSERQFYFPDDISIRALRPQQRTQWKRGLRGASLPSPHDRSTLIGLTRIVSPRFSEAYDNVEALDKGFIQNLKAFRLLKSADDNFKQARILHCHRNAVEVLDELLPRKLLDPVEWYFCARALHILGNIFFLRSELDYACRAAFLSWAIKRTITTDLPELSTLASAVKFHQFFWLRRRDKKVDQLLCQFQVCLRSRPSISEVNRTWAKNLIADIHNAFAGHTIFDAGSSRDIAAQIGSAEKAARQAQDPIGEIRSAFLRYLIDNNSRKFAGSAESVLNLERDAREHPYARGFCRIMSTELGDVVGKRKLSEVRAILGNFGISQFKNDEILYDSRPFRRKIVIRFKYNKYKELKGFI